MALGLESSRHFPSAVALKIAENADGTRSVPASFEVNQVPFGASRRFVERECTIVELHLALILFRVMFGSHMLLCKRTGG